MKVLLVAGARFSVACYGFRAAVRGSVGPLTANANHTAWRILAPFGVSTKPGEDHSTASPSPRVTRPRK